MSSCIKDLYDYDLVSKCLKCGNIILKSNFHKDETKNDGLRSSCKFCTLQYHYKNREKRKLHERKRLAIDFNYRLIKNTRRRIHHALKCKSKSSSTINILGIDIETCRRWNEWQMTPEMNWSNTEVDHVKPICMFDVSKDEELGLGEAFCWKNTRPLLKKCHQQKGTKFNY